MFISLLVASNACQPLVKPDWSQCIRVGMMFIRRVAIILASIFKTRFSKETGQNFWGTVGSFSGFGSDMIKACSVLKRNNEEEAESLYRAVKRRIDYNIPQEDHQVLGALAMGSVLIIDWISFSVNGLFTVEESIVPLLVVGALFVLGICLCFLVRVEMLWDLV